VFLSSFGSFSQLSRPTSVVTLQDPPLYRGELPSFQLYTCFSPPSFGSSKPQVACYVFSDFLKSLTLLPRFFDRGDIIVALALFTPAAFFHPSLTKLSIINSYCTKGASNNIRIVPPDLIFPILSHPPLTLGELNLHYLTSDPLRRFKDDEIATSTPYFDRATELSFSLLNPHSTYTRFSMSHVGRPGVLDLALACPLLVPFFSEWSDPLPSKGCDHIPILIRHDPPLFREAPPSPNWALTYWPALESDLKALIIRSPPALLTSRSMGTWFDTNLNWVYATLALHTPLKRVIHRSNPWWFMALSHLRMPYSSALRKSCGNRLDASLLASARAAWASYFKAIKKAKRKH